MNPSLLSIPNAFTFLRFLGIPLFVYLTLSIEADGWAIVVLAIGGGATSAIWSDGAAGGTFTNNTGSTPNTTTYTASSSAPSRTSRS